MTMTVNYSCSPCSLPEPQRLCLADCMHAKSVMHNLHVILQGKKGVEFKSNSTLKKVHAALQKVSK